MREFDSPEAVKAAIGTKLGVSDWARISQDRINRFADATGDDQWIHTDPKRAANGPYGSTVAHGYLTLSLIPWLASRVVVYRFDRPRINYGLNRVRFPRPVLVGSRVRLHATLVDATEGARGLLLKLDYQIEAEPANATVCAAEALVLFASLD